MSVRYCIVLLFVLLAGVSGAAEPDAGEQSFQETFQDFLDDTGLQAPDADPIEPAGEGYSFDASTTVDANGNRVDAGVGVRVDGSGEILGFGEGTAPTPQGDIWGKDVDGISRSGGSTIIDKASELRTPTGDLKNVNNFRQNDDGSQEFDYADEYSWGNEFMCTDCRDFRRDPDGTIHIGEGGIIDFRGIQHTDVEGFIGNKDTKVYDIIYAESLRAGCFDARDVKDAHVELNDELYMRTKQNTQFPIYFGFQNKIDYKSTDDPNQLIFNPGACTVPLYRVFGVNLTISNGRAKEHIEADGEASVQLSQKHGVECVQFTPEGTYSYIPDDMREAFALKAFQAEHEVCIRKEPTQHFDTDCEQCTLVDFTQNDILIDGQIEYRRLFYNEELNPINILEPGLNIYYTALTPSHTQIFLDEEFNKLPSIESLNSKPDDIVRVTNWLEFRDHVAQRDAFVHLPVTDYSLPLLKEYKTSLFEPIQVNAEKIDTGRWHFYFPDSQASNKFFERLIRRSELIVPPQPGFTTQQQS